MSFGAPQYSSFGKLDLDRRPHHAYICGLFFRLAQTTME